jgi:hypothetical protein
MGTCLTVGAALVSIQLLNTTAAVSFTGLDSAQEQIVKRAKVKKDKYFVHKL